MNAVQAGTKPRHQRDTRFTMRPVTGIADKGLRKLTTEKRKKT